ncbi:Quinol monooxygenase YgiN [Paramicrobacterium humi]|uniref:Quinol monooxygenase YgiN n=1 Tax=Paramicrobacterium humi TaxID=640635 RepID=A0A1H4LBT8_9MICO|nr:putative quinol monooxygenase [Microbacterium humi]SEB68194.1 Quinol monooxygenase YgiN [Microbacterium humi]
MLTVFVTMDVHPERVDEFLAGLLANAEATRSEPGCLRFEIHRSVESPERFMLYEIYRDDDAFYHEHRGAPHYPAWREVVERCVVPGSSSNTYARPVNPEVMPA